MPIENRNLKEPSQLQLLMAYAAELELEVDRLRRRDQFLQQETQDHIRSVKELCSNGCTQSGSMSSCTAISDTCEQFAKLLSDVNDPPGYHPAFDQVVAIAIGPLAEQVFRSQQRLSGVTNAVLRLDLQPDHIEWFPARLRHILDNLISNALRYCDLDKGEVRVGLRLRAGHDGYELHFTDNGVGITDEKATGMLDLFYRAAPTRAAGLGVGLSVVKLIVEQSCGTISISSGRGQGTSVTVGLPRYDMNDHI